MASRSRSYKTSSLSKVTCMTHSVGSSVSCHRDIQPVLWRGSCGEWRPPTDNQHQLVSHDRPDSLPYPVCKSSSDHFFSQLLTRAPRVILKYVMVTTACQADKTELPRRQASEHSCQWLFRLGYHLNRFVRLILIRLINMGKPFLTAGHYQLLDR